LNASPFKPKAEARMAAFEWLKGWYNPHRRHSSLGYLSAISYERKLLTNATAEIQKTTRPPKRGISRARRNGRPIDDHVIRSETKMKQSQVIFTALAVLATSGVVMTTAHAQTNGMERRGDRRDNRDEGRDAKAACKAGDEESRPECRQEKRDTKQEGRGDDQDKSPTENSPAEKPPTEKPPGT
jgi:hypothetical protein